MTEERPKRRWYQFSLKTLLVTVLMMSLAFSWFAAKRNKARKQREAVEAIEKLGGWVGYEHGAVVSEKPHPGVDLIVAGEQGLPSLDETHLEEDLDPETREAIRRGRIEVADDQLAVSSNFHLFYSRPGSASFLYAGQRRDVLRRGEQGLRIASREIVMDIAEIEYPTLGLFF